MRATETISLQVKEKGDRLIAEGKVRRIRHNMYEVEGDHGIYTVAVSYPQEVTGVCDCPAKGICSHLYAASVYHLADPPYQPRHVDPFASLECN